MSNLEFRSGLLAAGCAMLAVYLVILDVATTPSLFENGKIELALVAPLALWLIERAIVRRARPHS